MEEKGITITFRGETVEFDKSLDRVNKDLKALKSEMSTINKQLKLDPKNIDLLAKKFENLKKQQEVMAEKVDAYKQALAQIDKADVGGAQWLALNRELGKAQVELDTIKNRLANMPDAKTISLQKTFSQLEKDLSKVGGTLEKVGKSLMVVSGAVAGLGAVGIKYNAQLEQYQVALTTLLGSEEEAAKVMNQIQEDASKTPFDVDSLIQANSLLISAGVDADETRDVIIALGDAISATGGGSAELARMAQNLQQVKNVGKATAQDIKQFANAGINIYGLLADYTGKTTEQIKDMDISFDVLSEALKSASQEGGKYFGAMEKQSQTINGLLSTLKDTMSQLLGELTASLMPVVKRVIDTVNGVIERIRGMSDGQKQLITNIGLFLVAIGPVLLVLGKFILSASNIAGKVKDLLPLLAKIKTSFGAIVGPIGILIGVFAVLYATNEEFRDSVNNLIKTLVDLLMPVIQTIIGVVRDYIIPLISSLISAVLPVLTSILEFIVAIVQKLVEWITKLWTYLKDRGAIDFFATAFKNVANVLQEVVGWVKDLFGWFGQLVDRAKAFLGLNGQIQQQTALTDGRGLAVNYGSGGYASGGFASGGVVLHNTINVNNSGSTITTAQVMGWADLMTARINENLGRMV